jgi:hypothetical protein
MEYLGAMFKKAPRCCRLLLSRGQSNLAAVVCRLISSIASLNTNCVFAFVAAAGWCCGGAWLLLCGVLSA